MKPGDTAEVTPVLAVRRAGISSSQEPWQQDSGPMDPPGDDPWTPCMGTHTLTVNSSLACGPRFQRLRPEAAGHMSAPHTTTHARLSHAAEAVIIQKRRRQTPVYLETPRVPLSVSPGSPSWAGPVSCEALSVLWPSWPFLHSTNEQAASHLFPGCAPAWCTPSPFPHLSHLPSACPLCPGSYPCGLSVPWPPATPRPYPLATSVPVAEGVSAGEQASSPFTLQISLWAHGRQGPSAGAGAPEGQGETGWLWA